MEVQFSHSVVFDSLWHPGLQHQASMSITNSRSLLKLISIKSVMPSNYLILCHPLLLPPSIFPSIRVFSGESVLCIRWPKYWSFSFSISPSNEYSGLISFRVDSLDLFAVQGTLKSLLQHHSSKASILQRSTFFIVQILYSSVSMNSMKRQKDRTLKDELPRSVGAQYATGDQWRNNSRKNEETEPKQKHPVVDETGDGSKV